MEKRYYSAIEVEKIMNEARKNDGFTGEFETKYVAQYTRNAIQNGKVGDKILMVVNPLHVHIPKWQRELDITIATYIGNNYNSAEWELPKIIAVKGKWLVIDGQHRIFGAFKAGMESVCCEFLDIKEIDAIKLFLNQSKHRKPMSPANYYNASIEAKEESYLKFKKICEKYNVSVKNVDVRDNPCGVFTAITDGIKTVRNNADLFERILALINTLQWNQAGALSNPYSSKVFRPLKQLYAYNVGKEDEMEKILFENCRDVVWFNDHLGGKKSQAEISVEIAEALRNGKMNIAIFQKIA